MSLFYLLYIVYFTGISLLCLILWKTKLIDKDNFYLIIPVVCIGFWAIHWLILIEFVAETSHFDFGIYYLSGRQIWINPSRFYKEDFGYSIGIAYLPFFLVLWAISLSLLPYAVAFFIWYVILFIIVSFFILEFNKLLILVGLKKRWLRLLFLIIISNGWPVFHQFALCQTKFLIGLILFYILRREIQYKKEEREKNSKYYWSTYFLFIFIIGMVPYLLLLLLIYLFHDISKDELFENENLKKYGMIIIIFLAQNFLFFLFPNLIFDFLKIWRRYQGRQYEFKHFYLTFIDDVFSISDIIEAIVSIILLIILYGIIIFLIITKRLQLVEKFCYFAVSFIYLNYLGSRIFVFLLPLILLLFIPFINQESKGKQFIKENKVVLLGLISISGIYAIVFRVNPYYPSFEGMVAGYLIFAITLGISLLILYIKKEKSIEEES